MQIRACIALTLIAACASGDDVQRVDAGDLEQLVDDHVVGRACTRDSDCAGRKAICSTRTPRRGGEGSKPTPGGYCSAVCRRDEQCGLWAKCIDDRCVSTCSAERSCRDGYWCEKGTCESITDDPGAATGSDCDSNLECGFGTCLRTLDGLAAPGGYCSGDCFSDEDCKGGHGICDREPGTAVLGLCLYLCYSEASCWRDGYRCRMREEHTVCMPGSPLLAIQAGTACVGNSDCRGATCLSYLDGIRAPGGYCSQRCVQDADCGRGGFCRGGQGGVFETGMCYATCDEARACREGYTCKGGACVPQP
jgi:hypothetical protein